MHKTYENLCQMLEKEICNIEQAKTLTKESLEILYYMTGSLDNIKELMEYGEDSGMSNRYEMSGARRRDSMGRYMDYGNSYENYARGNSNGYGYSRDDSRKKMVRKLETLMDDTMSENERQAIQDCINRIQ